MITKDIDKCIAALTNGELVAFPTETVFGLGARSDSPAAVNKIFDIKKRPTDHPLIAHCSRADTALAITPYLSESAIKLAEEFWPGPMTLVFKRAQSDAICNESLGGHDTVAIRVPAHPTAFALLDPCSFFVSAPSANKFGRVSATTAQHVLDEFGNDLLILDGEQSQCGLESTIISCLDEQPRLLRPGAITPQDILRVTGCDVSKNNDDVEISAPGDKESHYAPNIEVILASSENNFDFKPGCESAESAFLSLSPPLNSYKYEMIVSTYDDFAHEIYDFFREAENRDCKAIYVVTPVEEGIGIAINDRLKKAAHTFIEANQ